MLNEDYLGNESFAISLTDSSVFLNEILISTIKFIERLLKPQGYIAL